MSFSEEAGLTKLFLIDCFVGNLIICIHLPPTMSLYLFTILINLFLTFPTS